MKINIFILFFAILSTSCKESKKAENKATIFQNEKKTSKKEFKIPSELKIEKREEINIDDDEVNEIIITAVDEKAEYFYEFWFKNDVLIYQFKYPWGSINKKWLINLDSDKEKEILRIQGYEDGVDYAIYDLVKKNQIPILYFNPIIIDNKYPEKYIWAYPNDIKDLILSQNNEIQVSLANNYSRDDEYTQPENQIELPFVFFNGQSTQSDMRVEDLNKPQFLDINTIIKKVRKTKENLPSKYLSTKIVKEYDYDLDRDGINDKILLYQNVKESGEFEREHFGLPMVIKKGLSNNNYQTWYENNFIIPKNNFNCATEGFLNIVFKDNYFTIENEICSDYISILSYTTFKILGDKILLHKYGDTYFDKANHDKKIPSKNWTTKDFGEVKFENVTEDFLVKLRQTKPRK